MTDQPTQFDFFEVGGAVRDSLMGLSSKDVDFSVVAQAGLFADAATAFAALEDHLKGQGFKIFESRAEFLTIRAQVAAGHPLQARTKVADFVLARKDGPYSDGRRPDWVKPGTLHDDLSRRDFTSGAIAKCIDGTLIDPFNGAQDIQDRKLRFVGNAQDRVAEDGLRVLRCFRFEVTKGFSMDEEAWQVCTSPFGAEMLSKVSAERVREELNKMFRSNTLQSLQMLSDLPVHTREAIFRDGLRLDATFAH